MTRKQNRIHRHRGNVMVYVTIGMVAFAGYVSLGVDFSHVLLVRNELQFAADAAARYAAAGLGTSVSQAKSNAVTAAGEMYADGSKVALDSTDDVIFGTWSGGSFTVLTGANQSSANAVKVTCHRTAAGGNAVALSFASLLGMSTADITVSTTAMYTSSYIKGIIGLNYVTMSGSAFVNSYNSTTSGPYSAGVANQNARVISNKNITMSGSATIYGNAIPGPGYTATGGIVTGSRTAATSPIVCPSVSVGSNATTNNNAAVASYTSNGSFNVSGSNTATMPGGTYCFQNFIMSGQSILDITGPVVIYVTGTLDLSGSVYTAQSVPSNLQIYVASTQNSTLSGSTAFYGEVYAPQSNVTISGQSGFCGSCVGASLTISGSGGVHWDESLGGTSSGGVSIVQ